MMDTHIPKRTLESQPQEQNRAGPTDDVGDRQQVGRIRGVKAQPKQSHKMHDRVVGEDLHHLWDHVFRNKEYGAEEDLDAGN